MSLVSIINNESKTPNKCFVKISGTPVEITKGFAMVDGVAHKIFDNGFVPPEPPPPPVIEPSNFLAAMFDGSIRTSDDGINFFQQGVFFNSCKKKVLFVDGYYYVVELEQEHPNAKRSINGQSWQDITMFPDVSVADFYYGDGKFIVLEYNGTKLCYATDPMESWTIRNTGLPIVAKSARIKFYEDESVWYLWCSTAANATTGSLYRMLTIQDAANLIPSANGAFQDLPKYWNGEWFAASLQTTLVGVNPYKYEGHSYIQQSYDGITFTTRKTTNYVGAGKFALSAEVIASSVVSAVNVVNAKTSGDFAQYSAGAVLEVQQVPTTDNGLRYISYWLEELNGMMFAIANRGGLNGSTNLSNITAASYSENGLQWTSTTMFAHNSLSKMIKAHCIVYVCSLDNVCQATKDGVNWEIVSFSGEQDCNNVSIAHKDS